MSTRRKAALAVLIAIITGETLNEKFRALCDELDLEVEAV